MQHRRCLLLSAAIFVFTGCFGSGPRSLRIETGGEVLIEVRLGAILHKRNKVASLDDEGRIRARDGRLIAWVRDDRLRLAGGTEIPFRTDGEGTVFLGETAQREAGLEPLAARIRADGSLEKGRQYRVVGADSDRDRRVALFVLLALNNELLP